MKTYDINDQLLLAQGAGYDDSHIYGGTIVMKRLTKGDYYSYFIIDCAETRERLCFNLKINRYWSKFLRQWVVTDKEQTIVKPCTTQEEISDAINTVALEILRGEK